MAKRYDAAIKQLVERYPADWITFIGLPLPLRGATASPIRAVALID